MANLVEAAMVRTLRSADYLPPESFPVVVQRFEEVSARSLHTHEFFELVVVTGGRGVHVTGRDAWDLSAGDVFVITGDRPHRYARTERLALYNILYDPARLELAELDLGSLEGYHALFALEPAWRRRQGFRGRLRLSLEELGGVEALVAELDRELEGGAGGHRYMARALFMQLVCRLSRLYGRSGGPASRALLRIARAIRHIEERFDEEISLDSLARIAGTSRRSFQRAFREATGTSPIDYLVRLRVRRAAERLRSGAESVTRIAFAVGFNDSNYFARAFRKAMGMSPRDYRGRSFVFRPSSVARERR
jgi:AraC family L-rhamnose operon transcriptional activator RhaR/AraC family L-rhamnose operon regulatory protein RhaS